MDHIASTNCLNLCSGRAPNYTETQEELQEEFEWPKSDLDSHFGVIQGHSRSLRVTLTHVSLFLNIRGGTIPTRSYGPICPRREALLNTKHAFPWSD